MNDYPEFCQKFEAFKEEWGEQVAEQTLAVLATVLWWLRREGHGQLTLSAVDHRFQHKLESRSILHVKRCLNG